ncbi:MBL fold metallo-hydrolase [Candidatus Woesearchaeota archaeon]|nr:MBL fold metallo-hydrolase [Candidatus Woesearchaeota archaeon]
MRITLFGTRGSRPVSGLQYNCYGGDTTCAAVFADSQKTFILDAGTGICGLNQIGDKELYLLLTHLHWDHIQGLPFFEPAYNTDKNVLIYGKANGKGVKKVLENQHERMNFPVPFDAQKGIKDIFEFGPGEEIYDDGELSIDTLLQNHPSGGSIAYRFRERRANGEYATFVFSTDYEPEHNWLDDKVAEFWNGADLVIADMQYEPQDSEREENKYKPGWGHSDYKSGIRLATVAEVKKLVGTHFNPLSTDNYLVELESRMKEEAGRVAEQLGKTEVETGLAQPLQTHILPSESYVL